MADKQTQALKRLTKKLSALRKTLRKDEREILDQLVLGEAAAEVRGHRVASASYPIAFDGKASSYIVDIVGPEVEGHMLTERAHPIAVPKVAKVA